MAYIPINTTLSAGNLDYFLVYITANIPTFPLYILMFIMFAVTFATYFGTKRFTGEPSMVSSFVAGSLTSSLVATLMTLTPGIMTPWYLSTSWAITFVFIVLYIFNKD